MSKELKCPNCGDLWDSDDWFSECLDDPLNLICDECDCIFSAKVKIVSWEWEIKRSDKNKLDNKGEK